MLEFVPDHQKTIPRGHQPVWLHRNAMRMSYNAVYLHGELEEKANFDIVYLAKHLGHLCGIELPDHGP